MGKLKCIGLLVTVVLLHGCGSTPSTNSTITITDASLIEGDSATGNLIFTISLSQVVGDDVTVDYATTDGTATAGSDYTAVTGTATIAAGNSNTTVSVSVIGDTEIESDETFTLSLSNVSGANLSTSSAMGTITDDDGGPGGPYTMYHYSNSLHAVDISDPSRTVHIGAIDIGSDNSDLIITGDISISNTALDNLRPHTFVYFNKRKFWRIDLSVNSNLIPEQISSADVGYVCYMDVVENTVSPLDSYVIYLAGLTQNECLNNGQAYAVRVGDSSSTSPISLNGIISTQTDVATNVRLMTTSAVPGEVTGFLVTHTTDLTITLYDKNFANPATVITASSFLADRDGGDLVAGISFFYVDGSLYAYTHDSSSTAVTNIHESGPGLSFDDSPENDFICNPTHCFFTEVDSENIQTVIKAAIDGSGSSVVNTFVSEDVLQLMLTNGRLYMNTRYQKPAVANRYMP